MEARLKKLRKYEIGYNSKEFRKDLIMALIALFGFIVCLVKIYVGG